MLNKSEPQTLKSQKEELGSTMDSSDHGTMLQREMMKILTIIILEIKRKKELLKSLFISCLLQKKINMEKYG